MHAWFEDLARAGPLFVLYPRVFRVIFNKWFFASDCYVWRVVVYLGLCLLGGGCVSQRRLSMGSCPIFFQTCFFAGKRIGSFGNLSLLEFSW